MLGAFPATSDFVGKEIRVVFVVGRKTLFLDIEWSLWVAFFYLHGTMIRGNKSTQVKHPQPTTGPVEAEGSIEDVLQ